MGENAEYLKYLEENVENFSYIILCVYTVKSEELCSMGGGTENVYEGTPHGRR